MQFSILPLSLLFSLATAQSSSSSLSSGGSSACAAQPVLESCLASTEAIAIGCSSNDYNCLCDKYTEVLLCFNQCPNDARQPSRLSLKQTYCSNAETYTSSTVKPISRSVAPVTTSAITTGDASEATSTGSSDDVRVAGSSTSAGASASQTPNAAGKRELAAGGILMGVAGLVGAFL